MRSTLAVCSLFFAGLADASSVEPRTCAVMPNGCPTRYSSGADECVCAGPKSIDFSVCGRAGTAYCDEDCFVDPSTVTAAHQPDGSWYPEGCNDCDDDADGYKDNPVRGQPGGALSRSCTTGAPAGSGCVGVQSCGADHAWGACVYCGGRKSPDGSPMTCSAEACNGLDDNCNGATDEGGVCRVDRCSCQPTTCAQQGVTCGPISNGCGGTLDCGGCGAGETCLDSGSCCARATCTAGWCGSKSDQCGGTLECGCPGSQVCRSNGTCCQPTTCAAQGRTCGTIPDGCGGTLECGSCGGGETCLDSGTCCALDTCAAHGQTCGARADGCGGTLACGTCGSGQVCTGGTCCTPTTCQALPGFCGVVPDGCGGTLDCGGCAPGKVCQDSFCAAPCPYGCSDMQTCCDGVCSWDPTCPSPFVTCPGGNCGVSK